MPAHTHTHRRLKTAIVYVLNPTTGYKMGMRIFLDSGSSHSFIAPEWLLRWGLEETGKYTINIASFGNSGNKQEATAVRLKVFLDQDTSDYMTMELLAVERFVNSIPSYKLSEIQRQRLDEHNIALADPEADKDGKLNIDILIGQDYYNTFQTQGELFFPEGLVITPTPCKTYMLGGSSVVKCNKAECQDSSDTTDLNVPSFPVIAESLDPDQEQKTLDRFCDLESLGISPLENVVHPILEKFNSDTTHNGTRYVVKLPWKETHYKKLSSNFPMAFKRFLSWHYKVKRKKDSKLYLDYCRIMKEQLDQGILEEVESIGTVQSIREAIEANPHAFDRLAVYPGSTVTHYLPWHGVKKASTGKLRIVNDASARPGKGAYSLNDCLETGPDLMNYLLHILLQFRRWRYACKADIEKAFLMVEIALRDRDALRLLWATDDIVKVLRFARLPFGLSCSPFLLAAVLKKHLDSSDIDRELIAQIMAAFYVDDNIWSVDTFEELMERQGITRDEFLKAGMKLRQWNSNSEEARKVFKELGDDIPEEESVLGIKWKVLLDTISINADRILQLLGKTPATKRKFWSFISQLYDPLGLLAPYTVLAKMLTREVSAACKGWDSKLPKDLAIKVTQWMEDFKVVPKATLPRHVGIINAKSERLVCFCDASSKAIAACVYLVSTDAEGEVVSNLFTAKSRIAPSSPQSIPKLELLAAVLGVNLMAHVRKVVPEVAADMIHYFSDSRNVIFWIYSGSSSWPTFVANGRKSVVGLSEIQQWAHVDTSENPADLPTRGWMLSDLIDIAMWWHGPEFLKRGIDCGKSKVDGYRLANAKGAMPEECAQILHAHLAAEKVGKERCSLPFDISKVVDRERVGSYDKLLGVTARVLKFAKNLLHAVGKTPKSPSLAKDDLRKEGEVLWIQAVQKQHYSDLFKLTASPEARVSKHMLGFFRDHGVFLDEEMGVLRVKTRLQESLKEYNTVYPILLPPQDHLSRLYIHKVHWENGHMGIPHTLSNVRAEFWIPQGRSLVKQILRRCNPCRKVSGPFFPLPKHSPLPGFRVCRSKAFQHIGVDFCGPFQIKGDKLEEWKTVTQAAKNKDKQKQNTAKQHEQQPAKPKGYMLIFTCTTTRAVHFEATLGLSVNDFIMAFQRFINVRGVPELIISDNAKTFKRCHKELDSIYKSARVQKFLEQKRIKWQFYIERMPAHGGFIEKMNDLLKSVCKKSFGRALLSFDEFRTMVSYAMSMVNDRPMTYVYSDIESAGYELTPSMLLHGHKLNEPPHLSLRKPKDVEEVQLGERYLLLEKLKDNFWKRWQEEYLTSLYERHSHQGRVPAQPQVPKENDVVLVKGEKTPRREWRLGRVLSVTKGSRDGLIRGVKLLTTNQNGKRSILNRSPSFLVPLEVGTHYVQHIRRDESKGEKTVKAVGFKATVTFI